MYYDDAYIDPQLFDAKAFQQTLNQTQSPIPVFRNALKQGDEILNERFEAHSSAREVVPQRAWLMDRILEQAWQLHAWSQPTQLALIAVGGYGRQELHPASDIDLLLLANSDLDPETQSSVENFLMFLWDIGLEVGHSVRTLNECQEAAKADITVITNLMESRLLMGEQYLFEAMQSLTLPENIWADRDFFEGKAEEQCQRHHKFYDTAYNLEPNIKDGPGGLRDIQTIAWVAKRHFNANQLHDLIRYGFLTEEEYKTLIKAQEFLWRIRYMLHQLTGRHEDRLGFDYQRTLAKKFGFEDGEKRLGVEAFMKQYYRTAWEVNSLNEILLQLFEEAILYSGPTHIKPLSSRFQVCNGFIEITHDKVFADYPFSLLEIFLMLQHHPEIKGIRASTARLLRYYTYLIDTAFHKDLRARSLFFEIIRQPNGITRALRMMARYGVLASYLPAFGAVTGQMQYDLFHVYTVDQHTLFLIRNLRRFTIKAFRQEFPLCSDVMADLPKPELLYLAGLFHDIAKGRGGDHSALGQPEALEFCKAHGLSDFDSRFVAWLVKSHLLMSTTAQRQDITDPDVINAFAQRMGDKNHLDYLYLLTVADIRATNPTLWNSWKGSLLESLYHKTKYALIKGLQNPIDKNVRVRDIQVEARRLLQEHAQDAVNNLWQAIHRDYFLRTSPSDIAQETHAMLDKPANQPLVMIRDGMQGCTEFMIYSENTDSLFVDTTLYLEQQNVTIVDAYLVGTASGHCTLLNYTVLEEEGQPIESRERAETICRGLMETLLSDSRFAPINRRQPPQVKHFPVPTRVVFKVDYVNQHTVMEIVTTDRPGVLSRIAQAMMKCDVRIKNAKIATFGTRVEDTFHITDSHNRPLNLPDQLDKLQEQLSLLLDETQLESPASIAI